MTKGKSSFNMETSGESGQDRKTLADLRKHKQIQKPRTIYHSRKSMHIPKNKSFYDAPHKMETYVYKSNQANDK